jgi:hypothetical protein
MKAVPPFPIHAFTLAVGTPTAELQLLATNQSPNEPFCQKLVVTAWALVCMAQKIATAKKGKRRELKRQRARADFALMGT